MHVVLTDELDQHAACQIVPPRRRRPPLISELEAHMGRLDGILGNASRVDPAAAAREYGRLLSQGEQVHAAYQLIRDSILFTDRRLILVDKQGVTGKKVEYHSLPYRSITHFAVETAGTFDLDAELKIWLSGLLIPITKRFSKGVDVYEVQAILSAFVAR